MCGPAGDPFAFGEQAYLDDLFLEDYDPDLDWPEDRFDDDEPLDADDLFEGGF